MIVSILIKHISFIPDSIGLCQICEASLTRSTIPWGSDPKQRYLVEMEGVMNRAAMSSDSVQCVKFSVFGGSQTVLLDSGLSEAVRAFCGLI
jgi:hypothetical protein